MRKVKWIVHEVFRGKRNLEERMASLIQGDIVGLLDGTGKKVVSYRYDSWSKLIPTTGTLGKDNPFRYRGYYYDEETGLYWLLSRYYDPEVGRFINEDIYLSTGHGMLGYNMFLYCENNPANLTDDGGRISYTCFDDTDGSNDFFPDVSGGGGYHYGVDTSIAVRSSITYGGLLNCGYVQYDYYVPAYGTGKGSTNKAQTAPQQLVASGLVPVIGKMADLNKSGAIKPGEFRIADYLPDMGNPKENWYQNSGILRSVMKENVPIRDASIYPLDKAGFLGAERNLLQSKGWTYFEKYWYPPR